MTSRIFKLLVYTFLFTSTPFLCFGQNEEAKQKTIISNTPTDTNQTDTARITETAPLDIAQNRGLFIKTPDGNMQLRILGSVRYLVVFDQLNLPSKNSFSTYDIPTGEFNNPLPNYYNGLDQTRLGFEVTRKTQKGDIFIRLETDFTGPNGFRIRHSYGSYGKFLFGQTWSLFSHVNALPSMVDFAGPTASLIMRTPQIRYSIPNIYKEINLAVSLEYIIPNVNIPDSIGGETFQLIPDVSLRLDKVFSWGSSQLSLVIPTLSGLDSQKNIVIRPGWGISGSVVINSWKKGQWHLQGVVGQSITRYFNDLSDNGLDLVVNSEGKIYSPLSYGFYLSYEHRWTNAIYSNFTYGWVGMDQYNFDASNTYREGFTIRSNTFWDITDGSKIGAEFIWGERIDKNYVSGNAVRFNLLFYYDF